MNQPLSARVSLLQLREEGGRVKRKAEKSVNSSYMQVALVIIRLPLQ